MVTARNATSGTAAIKPTGFPAIADSRMAGAASTAIGDSAITRAPEPATKTSPMAKTNLGESGLVRQQRDVWNPHFCF
jgi:hypothetical protein